jgi:hypothetical protein
MYGREENAYVLLFIDLIVQESVCISRQQDEDAKGKIAARTRRQNAGTGWLNTLETERGGSQVSTAYWIVGRDLGQQIQLAYNLCRETKFCAHYSGRWELTQ